LVMLIAPSWLYTSGYNLFMGAALVAAAIAVKVIKNATEWCKQLEDEGHAIALEFVVLGFFSFVLPIYYPEIYAGNARRWGVFVLSFIAVLVIVGLLIKRMSDLENERRNLSLQMERQKSYAGQIQSQFERMVTLRHYYNNMYMSLSPLIRDNNIEGLRFFFEENITPIHLSQIDGMQISNIKDNLLRNFIDVTTGQADAMENITLDINISGEIRLPDHMLLDVFEIISNFIDNAMRELKSQSETQSRAQANSFGLLRIWMHESDGQLSIQIANTINGTVDIEQIYNRQHGSSENDCEHHTSYCENGYGLKRVREIVYSHPQIQHLTYRGSSFE